MAGIRSRTRWITLDDRASREYVSPFMIALVNAGLGEFEAMREALTTAVDEHDAMASYASVDPRFRPTDGPGIDDILERMGLGPGEPA